jgi:urease accessory protein
MSAFGQITATRQRGATAIEAAVAQSPLRFLFPKPTFAPGAHPAWVCLTTLGGGMVQGDAIDLNVDVQPDATLLMTTQASTKIFRGASRQALRATVEGTLAVLMDPISCFKDASYSQKGEIDLAPGASLIWLETVTSGRPAFEESFSFEKYSSKLRVTQNGAPVFVDSLLLGRAEGSIASRFEKRDGAPFDTFSTIVALGPNTKSLLDALLAPADLPRDRIGDVAVAPTALSGAYGSGAIVRIAATSAEAAARETRSRLRNLPEILMVDPFASRW